MSFKPMPLSMVERLQGRNLYLCVRVDGEDPSGHKCYAYFGIFFEDFQKLLRHLETNESMNPKDANAIVLARSTGIPSPEIREFMRMKFSFADETKKQPIILEISK